MKMAPTRVCVFCGSSAGRHPAHMEAARSLAQVMHRHSIQLIYGGGTTGIMGEIAKTLVALSGQSSVLGVIPASMLSVERKVSSEQKGLPRNWSRRMGLGGSAKAKEAQALDKEFGSVMIVDDLSMRKQKMMELVRGGGEGSGFVALSGGFGTMDELMEVVNWRQIGVHQCGIVLFSVRGFWDGVVEWINRAIEDGFVRESGKDIVVELEDAESVITWLNGYAAGTKSTKPHGHKAKDR